MTQINKLSDIVDNGLCIGCGLCQSITGKDSIEILMSSKAIIGNCFIASNFMKYSKLLNKLNVCLYAYGVSDSLCINKKNLEG